MHTGLSIHHSNQYDNFHQEFEGQDSHDCDQDPHDHDQDPHDCDQNPHDRDPDYGHQ